MDPLSMTASIIAILELTATFTSYINDVRNATKEQAKVAVEASSLYGLLTSLRFRVEAARSSDAWFNQVKLLGQQNGPLDQFKEVLEKMMTHMTGSRKRDQVKSALLWKVTKAQIDDALRRMERLKSLILCALTGDLSTLTQAIHDEVGNLGKQMEQLHIKTNWLQTHADQELRHRLVQWLGIPDPSTNYQAALRRRHPDTGLWLLNSPQFAEWKISKCSLMWLHGNAGCGKTILSAAALQEVLQLQSCQPEIAVAYFYFDFNDDAKQSSKKAIRSLLYQVASHTSDSLQGLQQLYQRCGNGQQQPSDEAIHLILNNTLTSLGSICIVLDALDECVDREDFITFLCCLVDLKLLSLRVLATSRRERDIEEQLRPIATANINIQSAIVDKDIRLYVQTRLRTDAKLRKWPDYVRDEISSVLMEKANGMFRWVYCQLESIRHCVKLRGLRDALSSLPKTLDETYERILQDLKSRGQLQDAITALRWLCFSLRPLRLSEVVEVLAIETGEGGGFSPDERLPDPADVMVVCSSLISYHSIADEDNDNDSESGELDDNADGHNTSAQAMMIRLAHFSVKEYLLSEHCAFRSQFQTSLSHQLIAEGCLQYLLYLADQGPLTGATAFEHPLARYAAEHWWQHARCVHGVDRQGVVRLASRLLTNHDVSLLLWVQLYNPEWPWRNADTSLTLADIAPALCYAALVGLPDVVGAVLDQGAGVHTQGGRYNNALQAASFGGHEKVVQMLLDAGADVHTQGGEYGNALQAASFGGNEKVVQILLDAGADVHTQGGDYDNALYAASLRGNEKVVQILLNARADVHIQGGYFGNVLQAASCGGDEKVVQMLLDAGADVHIQGGDYGNALQAASFDGNEKVVQMLLDAGADVHIQGDYYGNALQAASFGGNEKVVQILLDAGADVHMQGAYYGNALQAASFGGNEKVVQILLDARADVHIQGGYYGNALQAASFGGHEKVVQILLDAGADVHIQGGYYSNALQAASFGGNEKVVQILLDARADVHTQGGDYGNALQAASFGGHEKVVQILLDARADVHTQGSLYDSALKAASERGHEKVVQMLLNAGANVYTQGGEVLQRCGA